MRVAYGKPSLEGPVETLRNDKEPICVYLRVVFSLTSLALVWLRSIVGLRGCFLWVQVSYAIVNSAAMT